MLKVLLSLLILFTLSCTKKSGSGGLVTGDVTAPEESQPVAPTLMPLSSQSIFEWVNVTTIINANDMSGSDSNSAGQAISYECFVDQTVDGIVDESTDCSTLIGLNFNSSTGVLSGIIESGHAGVHEIKIKAKVESLSDEEIFSLTVHSLNSLTLSIDQNEIRVGETTQASAIGIYSNGWVRPMTSVVSWNSSQPLIASVTAASITSLDVGNSIITASFNSLAASANINVKTSTLSSIQINQINPTIPLNGSMALKATGFYTDGSSSDVTTQVQWSSDNNSIATVGTSTGVVSAQSAGTALISIELSGFTHQQTLTVTNFSVDSIAISPINPTGIIGLTTQLYATAFLSDGSTQDVTNSVIWSSATPAVATIDSKGKVNSLVSGTSLVTAQLGGISSQATFTVSNLTINSISITSLGATLSVGFQQTAKAIATLSNGGTIDVTSDAVWSVSDSSVASITNSIPKGRLNALSTGTNTVKAQLSSLQATQNITVTNASLSSISLSPASVFLWQGETRPLKAIGTFSDATTLDITSQVTWSSSDNTKIVMSNSPDTKGYAQVIYVGATTQNLTLTATLGAVSTNMNAIINPATLNSLQINTNTLTLAPNSLYEFKVFGHYSDGGSVDLTKSATWSSSDSAVGFISNALNDKGSLYSEELGVTSIRAQVGATQSNIVNVTVSDSNPVEIVEVGTGLRASYFTGMTFNTLRGVRIDSVINYSWGTGQAPLGVGDSFSIRWEGHLKSPVTASCRIHSYSDDGFRVYLDNNLILNDWSNHSARWANSNWINFTSGVEREIRVEFYENGGHAVAQLHWECSGEFARTLISRDYLFPSALE